MIVWLLDGLLHEGELEGEHLLAGQFLLLLPQQLLLRLPQLLPQLLLLLVLNSCCMLLWRGGCSCGLQQMRLGLSHCGRLAFLVELLYDLLGNLAQGG